MFESARSVVRSSVDRWVVAACVVLGVRYAVSYFDRSSEYRGDRYWPAFCRVAGALLKPLLPSLECRLVWREDGGPPLRVEERPDDPVVDAANDDVDAEYRGQCVYCSHPHGALSLHHIMFNLGGIGEPFAFSDFAPLRRRRDLAASILFRVPILREAVLYTGMVMADRAAARRQLADGNSLLILVGGEAEQMLSARGREIAYVANRKGFCRLALEQHGGDGGGVPLVPIYVFGETDLVSTFTGEWSLWSARWWIMKRFRVALPLGIPNFLLLWRRANGLVACVGRPVVPPPLKPGDNDVVSVERVDALHRAYVAELRRTFDFYKDKVADGKYRDRTLEIL